MIRTRVAPSPTGFPHLGLVYQALFDYVIAKANNGSFILRIEDTDRTRFVEGAEKVITDTLSWIGLMPDEGPEMGGEFGPYRQSERLPLYQKYAEQLIVSGHAYRCFCTKERLDEMRKQQEQNHQPPRYDRLCHGLSSEEVQKKLDQQIPFTIRMKIPDHEQLAVHDAIVGEVVFNSDEIDDQVIIKSDGFPTYHLAVVVDDHEMHISHVIRGTEWFPSYPKHVLLYRYFGWELPVFAHIPILLNSDGKGKLSKRHAHTSVMYYREEGFLPEAVVNYLANVVWNHPEGKEIFPLMDFAQAVQVNPLRFDIKANGVRFNLEKLLWVNGEYLRMMSLDDLRAKLEAFYVNDTEIQDFFHDTSIDVDKIIALAQSRMKILKDFKNLVIPVSIDLNEEEKNASALLKEKFEEISEWNKENILEAMRFVLQQTKIKGNVLYKILTGHEKGLPLPDSLEIIGKEKTLKRFAHLA